MAASTVGAFDPVTTTRFSRTALVFAALGIGLIVMTVVSAGHGQLDVPAREVIGSVLHRLGVSVGDVPAHPQGEAALWQVRFPRIVMGMLVGASLGGLSALTAITEAPSPASVAAGLVLVDVAHRMEEQGRARIGQFMGCKTALAGEEADLDLLRLSGEDRSCEQQAGGDRGAAEGTTGNQHVKLRLLDGLNCECEA